MKPSITRKNAKRLLALASAGAVSLLLQPRQSKADSYSWTGASSPTTSYWGTSGNWSDLTSSNSTLVPSTTSDDLTFNLNGGGVASNANAANSSNSLLAVNSITFGGNAGSYTLTAKANATNLTIGSGGIIDAATSTQTITEALFLPANVITPFSVASAPGFSLTASTVTVGAGGTLSLTGGGGTASSLNIGALALPGSATLAASNSTLVLPGFTVASNSTVSLAANGASGSVIEHNVMNMTASGASLILDGTGGGDISAGASSSGYGVSIGAHSGMITQQGGGTSSLAILNVGTISGIDVADGTFIMAAGASSQVPAFVGDTTVGSGGTFEVGEGNGSPTFGFGASSNNISLDGGTIETNGTAGATFGFVQGIIVNSSSSLKIQGQGSGTIGMVESGVISGTNSAAVLTVDASAVNGNNSAHVDFAFAGTTSNTFAGIVDYVGPGSGQPGALYLNASGTAVPGNLVINGNGAGVILGVQSASARPVGNTTAQNSFDQFSTSSVISLNSGYFNLGANTSSSILTYVQTGGTLSVNTGTLQANTFSIAGGTIATPGAGGSLIGAGASGGQFVFDTTNGNLSDPVAITGSFSGFSVIGGGTATLTANNTFTGGVTVHQGTLSLGASASLSAASNIIVGDTVANSGAVLDLSAVATYTIPNAQALSGYGTVKLGAAKTLVMSSGSSLQPGDAPGVLSFTGSSGKLSLAVGSNLVFDLSGANSNSDFNSVAGSLVSGLTSTSGSQGNLVLHNAAFSPGTTATYELFSYGAYSGDTGTVQPYGNDISSDFTISGLAPSQSAVVFETGPSNGQIDVAITSVPEPGSLSLLGLGALGLLARRKKPRRRIAEQQVG